MSAMDAAFLAMERPNEPRHIGSLSIFGAGPDGALSYVVARDAVAARLPLIASARRVVVEVPLGLARPSWAPDRSFDLDFHVRHAAIPAGGGLDALARLVAHAHARPLDRARPLWELWVVDGLGDGRVAIYTKVHVAAIDGVTGVELMTALLDADPAGRSVEPAAITDDEPPLDTVGRLLGALPDQVRWAAGFPARLGNRAARAVREQLPGLADTVAETVRRTPGLDVMGRLLPGPDSSGRDLVDERPTGRAPRVSFNAPITQHRRFAFTSLPPNEIVRIKQAAGTTFNDVVVAVCAGALRRWLLAHDELPTSPLIALVPVLVGGQGGQRERAHVAGLIAPLPTHVADPVERLQRTHEALRSAKERHAAIPASVMQDMSMLAPPAVAALAGRLVDAMPHRSFISPTVNLAITNVPGSRYCMYLAGRPLEVSYPVLSINDLSPLHIGLQSGPGAVGLGAVACRDTLDDLSPLVDAATIEVAELGDACIGQSRSRTAARRAHRDR